jgi:peptide/nickel transport system substrate-binding protein
VLGSRLAALLIAILLACAPPRTSATVVYASGADLESANPLVTIHSLARQVQRYALFVTLARYDTLLDPEPYLARHWEWSADRRELRMSLFTGLRWHDGRPTTARDVVFTLEAVRDPATGFPRAADLSGIEEVRAASDSMVVIRFRDAPPRFPAILCELPIAPDHLLATTPRAELRRSSFGLAPTGNGPFRFVRREPGRRWIFERVPDFPALLGGAPHVARLVVAVVDEPTTKFAGLVSADLDVAGIAPTMASLVSQDPALRVLSYPVSVSTAIVFNAAKPPFDDERVRRAIDGLIDRRRIVDAALAGFGVPADGPLSSDHPFHAPAARVPAGAAAALLDSAGWRRADAGLRQRNGQPLAFTLLTVGSGDNAIEQLVQADLREHGIGMEIRQVELGAFLAAVRETPRRFDAVITGIPGDLSLSHLVGMFSSRLAGGALDYGDFHEPRLDALLDAAQRASDDRALAGGWRAVQEELAGRAPAVWVYHARGVQGVSRRLTGVRMDLRGELATLTEWRIAEPAARGGT